MDDQQVMHAMGIDDAYHVERTLASGAGGATELVTLDGSGPFVRKRIPSKLARRGVWAMLSECDCARLPRVEATYEMPDEFVVVCDYVPGENLEQLVASRGRLDEKRAREIVAQLCDASAALHAHGIIHRDISPRNVVVAADGAHLIDLGIARFTTAGATHDTTQLGTPGFASPEQHGFAQTDARSDVYSLGRVLGYLLTGALPDVPETADYERLLADDAVVAPEVRSIIRRATAMEPSARFQSAEEFAAALRGECAAGAGPAPRPAPHTGESTAPRRRRPSFAQAVVGVMAVVSLVAVVLLLGEAGLLGAGVPSDGPDGAAATDSPSPSSGEGEEDGALSDTGAGAVGSGATSAVGGAAPASDGAATEIVESGWSVDEQGFVHYALALRNVGDSFVELPAYTITGRDESGAVIFSEEQVLSAVAVGETVWWGGLAGGSGEVPASVEFSPNPIADYQVAPADRGSAKMSVGGVRAVKDDIGGTSFVGEVALEDDGGMDFSQIALVVVLRDASGAIVFGDFGFVTRPEVGGSTSFEVSCYDVPDYATFEAHALEW